jgi:hypothetical protein
MVRAKEVDISRLKRKVNGAYEVRQSLDDRFLRNNRQRSAQFIPRQRSGNWKQSRRNLRPKSFFKKSTVKKLDLRYKREDGAWSERYPSATVLKPMGYGKGDVVHKGYVKEEKPRILDRSVRQLS